MNWDLLGLAVTIVFGMVGGVWTIAKVMARQFTRGLDERFAAQEKLRQEARLLYEQRFTQLEGDTRRQERLHLELLAKLPLEYVRREDQIRLETAIFARIDAVAAKIDLLNERQKAGG